MGGAGSGTRGRGGCASDGSYSAAAKGNLARADPGAGGAQLPIAGLNFVLMPDLEGGVIYLPGLALLMMGSQLLTWGCLGVLLFAENERSSVHGAPKLATSVAGIQ